MLEGVVEFLEDLGLGWELVEDGSIRARLDSDVLEVVHLVIWDDESSAEGSKLQEDGTLHDD